MVVQHNMQALNASRMLNIPSGHQSKSTEKLSSGFRINRAADDAAGLSISEKMRKQIRGLDQASTNAQDGVSAVQTAEGALTEVHSMLQRMNELAVQAANGTNSQTDRKSIQDEIDQLTTEIDRVAETTKFNETYLLKGDANGAQVTKSVNAHDAGLDGKLVADGKGTTTFSLTNKLKEGDSVTIAGEEYKIGTGKSVESYSNIKALNVTTVSLGDSITLDGKEYTLTNKVKIANITYTGANIGGETLDTYKPQAGDQITTKDGTVYQYYVKTTNTDGTLSDGANSVNVHTGWFKKDEFDDSEAYDATNVPTKLAAIAVEGSTIKLKNAQEANGLKEFEIVKKLDDGELSAYNLGNNGEITTVNMKALAKLGDYVTTTEDTANAYGKAYRTMQDINVAKAGTVANTAAAASNAAEGAWDSTTAETKFTPNDIEISLTAGDSVTVNGVTTTVTAAGFEATKRDEVAKAIGDVASGSQITLADINGKNGFTYTVVENSYQEKPGEGKLTRESIVGLLEEGQQVTIDPMLKLKDGTEKLASEDGGAKYSGMTDAEVETAIDEDTTIAAGDKAAAKTAAKDARNVYDNNISKYTVAGVATDEEGAISLSEAYGKMAEELQKASSIGTDTAATVANNNDGTFTIKQGTVTHADKLNFNLHVGADADMTNKITVNVNTMNSAFLGVKGLNVNDDTGTAATYAIDAIADAVAKVSEQRSALGAVQNRLEHTIANVDNVVENSTAAESRIRDTDMADEMVNFSKNNILAQAGQSMLAQANQATQGVLSILG